MNKIFVLTSENKYNSNIITLLSKTIERNYIVKDLNRLGKLNKNNLEAMIRDEKSDVLAYMSLKKANQLKVEFPEIIEKILIMDYFTEDKNYNFINSTLILNTNNKNNIEILDNFLKTYNPNKEFERKFTVDRKAFRNIIGGKSIFPYKLRQYYSFEKDKTVRYREYKDLYDKKEFYKEIKSDDLGVERDEETTKIKEEDFLNKIKYLDFKVLKTRFLFLHLNNDKIYIAELDLIKEFDEVIVEFEFFNKEEAKNFIMPKWCKEEVTRDKRFKNKNIARELFEKNIEKKDCE